MSTHSLTDGNVQPGQGGLLVVVDVGRSSVEAEGEPACSWLSPVSFSFREKFPNEEVLTGSEFVELGQVV